VPAIHRLVLPDTPIGPLTLLASSAGLREIRFGLPRGPAPDELSSGEDHPVLGPAVRALRAYFRGAKDPFRSLPLDPPERTPFQRAVLDLLRQIPRGSYRTYGELARALDRGSPRSVGQAVGTNPLPVVIPCHRVVAGAGRLGGFSGGLERKIALLELEGIRADGPRFGARLRDGSELTLPL
jgi:methylated-DNA-[protein]-cysteine S-methyltransferase